ncbi:MAG: hypothetical protein KDC10_02990 [Calditrichaeota bacterium]|nr:hypothetical protein [Calditrichota bacterium]MCB9473028.1 hypothetical protein [Candidatus Delongbacteria bacterium]
MQTPLANSSLPLNSPIPIGTASFRLAPIGTDPGCSSSRFELELQGPASCSGPLVLEEEDLDSLMELLKGLLT